MKKKFAVTILFALVAMTGQAQNTYTISCDLSILNEELTVSQRSFLSKNIGLVC